MEHISYKDRSQELRDATRLLRKLSNEELEYAHALIEQIKECRELEAKFSME